MSPYLFIICTEVLSAMCEEAQAKGSMVGVKISRGSPTINHLLFADDTMFFCRSNASTVATLLDILRTYEKLSGQRINFSKSSVNFSAKTPMEVKDRVKAALSIEAEGAWGNILDCLSILVARKRISSPLSSTA